MHRKILILVFSILMSIPLAAATPSADNVIDAAMNAAGGWDAFEAIGVLKMTIVETSGTDGKKRTTTAYVDTGLENSRMELPHDVIIVQTGNTGWATIGGKLDDRQQTPRMAAATCRQQLFPLLLPFSLKYTGLNFSSPVEKNHQGRKMLESTMTVPNLFFQSPLIARQWQLYFPLKATGSLIARYLPPKEFLSVHKEGAQYEISKRTRVGSIMLPSEVTVRAIDTSGKIVPKSMSYSVKYEILEDPDRGLFLSPEALKKLEEGDPLDS